MDTKTQQLNILMETMRDIIKAKACPDWVARKLAEGVKQAKSLDTDNSAVQADYGYRTVNVVRPFEIGELAASNIENDHCLYRIVDTADPIQGVNLYTIKIEKGDKNNPEGYTVYNVPETKLIHVKSDANPKDLELSKN